MLVRGVEKQKDIKNLVFPHVCLVGRMEKWEGGKLFCLVEEKNWRMENVVYINCLLCPYYIIYKKQIYLHSLNNIKIKTNTYTFILLFFIIIYNLKFMDNKIDYALTGKTLSKKKKKKPLST